MRHFAVGHILALILSILAAPLDAYAQQPKEHRIGWLITVPSSSAPTLQAIAVFRQALRDLGHVEGQNLIVVYRFAEGIPEQLPALAAELVSLKLDIIVTDGSVSTRAAQQATTTIPIVMVVSASPVEQGFVETLARPGRNITGLSMLTQELARKRLELLKDAFPKATRVAVLGAPKDPSSIVQWRDTEVAGRLLGLEMQALEVQSPNLDLERAFDTASRGRADALILLAHALFARDRVQIVALANKLRLPAMSFERPFAEAGGLMSYGPSIPDMFRRAATYVDKILKGAKPGDLPVEQPTKFELVLNQKTAKALGITFSPAILSLADEVIR